MHYPAVMTAYQGKCIQAWLNEGVTPQIGSRTHQLSAKVCLTLCLATMAQACNRNRSLIDANILSVTINLLFTKIKIALTRIAEAPVFPGAADSRRAAMLHAVLLTHSVLILLSMALIPILDMNKPGGYSVVLIWAAVILVCWASLFACRLTLAAQLISWTIFILATTLALLSPPLSIGSFFPAALYFAVLLSPRWGITAAIVALLIAIFVVLGGQATAGLPILFPNAPRAQVAHFGIQLVMFVVPIFLILRSQSQALQRADEELAKREKTELELRHLNDNLESLIAARTRELVAANEELDTFTHRVAHDVRGPLGQISGFVSLAKMLPAVAGDEKAMSHLNWAMVAAQRLMDLVSGLLSLANLGRAKLALEDVDLDALLADVVTGAQSQASGRAIDWRTGHLGHVRADRALIANVFTNLIQNALKFTRDRNPAIIEILLDAASTDTSRLTVCVKDNGVGFDMAHAGKLFQEFQRLHSSAQFAGSGVGLASCKRIIEMHGGEIYAHAELNLGAAFYFWLPRMQAQPPANAAA